MEEYRCMDCGFVGVPVNGRCKCSSRAIISEEIVKKTDLEYIKVKDPKNPDCIWSENAELATPIPVILPKKNRLKVYLLRNYKVIRSIRIRWNSGDVTVSWEVENKE